MKICIVGGDLNPPWVEGIRNLAMELAKKLENLGNEVHVVTRGNSDHNEEAINGVWVHKVKAPISTHGPAMIKKLGDVDIIHFQHMHINKSFLFWSLRHGSMGIRSVGYVSVPPFLSLQNWFSEFRKRPKEALTRATCISYPTLIGNQMSTVDETIVTSDHIKKMFGNANGSRIKVISPFIDVEKFADGKHRADEVRSRYSGNGKPLLLLYVGNHRWTRGEDQFLLAFAKVKKRYPKARAILVTPLPLAPHITRTIDQLALTGDSLSFISRDIPVDMPALYAASDVYVFAGMSSKAGFAASVDPPLSILEALAAGTRVVSYDIGAVGDLASQLDGLTSVPTGDNDLLANSILDLLERPSGREPRLEPLKAGFDSLVQAKKFVETYQEVNRN